MGIRKDIVEPQVSTAGQREDLDYPDGLLDAAVLTVFFKNLSNFMSECGVNDFTFNDVLKPETERLRFALSCVINYVRFRSEKDPIIAQYYETAERKRDQIDQLAYENEELRKKVEVIRKKRELEEPELQEAVNVNAQLADDLRGMQKKQSGMAEELEGLKSEKEKLKKQLVSIHQPSLI